MTAQSNLRKWPGGGPHRNYAGGGTMERRAYAVSPRRQYHGSLAFPLGQFANAPSVPGAATGASVAATDPAPAPVDASTWTAVDWGILAAGVAGVLGLGGLLFATGAPSTVAKVTAGLGFAGATALAGYASSTAAAAPVAASTPTTAGVGDPYGRYGFPKSGHVFTSGVNGIGAASGRGALEDFRRGKRYGRQHFGRNINQ